MGAMAYALLPAMANVIAQKNLVKALLLNREKDMLILQKLYE
jgi:hypothetical protein